MIPMRQFLREHQISGEVVQYAPETWTGNTVDGASYRVTLTHNGQLRAFEAQIRRPEGAPAPTVGEGLAEVARRIAAHRKDEAAGTPEGGAEDPLGPEARRLQQFIGAQAYEDLLFEFGHRPEAQIEDDDTTGEPARPDEMTNQEPNALTEAGAASGIPRVARYLLGAPLLILGAAGILLARGQRVAAVAVTVLGTLATVGGATSAAIWRRRRQRQSVKRTLQVLTDQNTAIQRGEAST
ncbi:MAG: hypothetical protein EPO16_12955 [Dehalococcoidia bacterium]|nr:MAG: hypothetical protein EPO16_12955 [Dehalococcoidia bacterium]